MAYPVVGHRHIASMMSECVLFIRFLAGANSTLRVIVTDDARFCVDYLKNWLVRMTGSLGNTYQGYPGFIFLFCLSPELFSLALLHARLREPCRTPSRVFLSKHDSASMAPHPHAAPRERPLPGYPNRAETSHQLGTCEVQCHRPRRADCVALVGGRWEASRKQAGEQALWATSETRK